MLRKLSFAVASLLMTTMLTAQFKKGDRMLGASVGTIFFNNDNTDVSTSIATSTNSSDNFGISFNPAIGWFINDNIAIGIMPAIAYNKEKIIGESGGSTYLKDESNSFNFTVGGFARYYFSGDNLKTAFFGQYDLAAGLGGSKTEGFQYETNGVYVDRYSQKSSGDFVANTGLSIGLSKFLASKTALDFYVGYKLSYSKSHPKGTFLRDYSDPTTGDVTQKPDYEQKFIGHHFVFGVGFQIFLEKKK
ncbi:MAG: hypothetical protein ACHQFX_03950 [Chitinophagales bacterium]